MLRSMIGYELPNGSIVPLGWQMSKRECIEMLRDKNCKEYYLIETDDKEEGKENESLRSSSQ